LCKSGAVDDEAQFELLLTAMMRYDDELAAIWSDISDGAESIPFEKFVAFLVDTQKVLYYYYIYYSILYIILLDLDSDLVLVLLFRSCFVSYLQSCGLVLILLGA
jgi:hypothetical protein